MSARKKIAGTDNSRKGGKGQYGAVQSFARDRVATPISFRIHDVRLAAWATVTSVLSGESAVLSIHSPANNSFHRRARTNCFLSPADEPLGDKKTTNEEVFEMAQPIQKKNNVIDFSTATLPRYKSTIDWQTGFARGALVDVTRWTVPGMGYGTGGAMVRIAVTARLWDDMVQRSLELTRAELKLLERKDVLWRAAAALQKARRQGDDAATFEGLYPNNSCQESLRVEDALRDGKRGLIVIGYTEEFLRL